MEIFIKIWEPRECPWKPYIASHAEHLCCWQYGSTFISFFTRNPRKNFYPSLNLLDIRAILFFLVLRELMKSNISKHVENRTNLIEKGFASFLTCFYIEKSTVNFMTAFSRMIYCPSNYCNRTVVDTSSVNGTETRTGHCHISERRADASAWLRCSIPDTVLPARVIVGIRCRNPAVSVQVSVRFLGVVLSFRFVSVTGVHLQRLKI